MINEDKVHSTKQAIISTVIFIGIYKYKLNPLSSTGTDQQNFHKEKKKHSINSIRQMVFQLGRIR